MVAVAKRNERTRYTRRGSRCIPDRHKDRHELGTHGESKDRNRCEGGDQPNQEEAPKWVTDMLLHYMDSAKFWRQKYLQLEAAYAETVKTERPRKADFFDCSQCGEPTGVMYRGGVCSGCFRGLK